MDRNAFDRIIASGGYISAATGSAPDGNAVPISKISADHAMDAAAALFTGAKVTHLNVLPQGQPERYARARNMVDRMNAEGFGHCTNIGECEAVCPKEINLSVIAQMNGDYLRSILMNEEMTEGAAAG